MYSDGTVTKDQSGWGLTVKQGATIIREDSAATRSQSPAWQWRCKQSHMPSTDNTCHTSQIQCPCYKKKKRKKKVEWKAQTGMCQRQCLTSTFQKHLPWTCQTWPSRQTGRQSSHHKWLEKSLVLRSLRHCLQAQSQGHHTINRMKQREAGKGGKRLDDLPWKDERGTSSIQWRLELFQYDKESKATLGNFQSDGVEHIASWTELNWITRKLCLQSVWIYWKWVD